MTCRVRATDNGKQLKLAAEVKVDADMAALPKEHIFWDDAADGSDNGDDEEEENAVGRAAS